MVMGLEEGDLVLTGTPKGVGEIKPGDEVECGILVEGKELKESKISVGCEEQGKDALYEYRET